MMNNVNKNIIDDKIISDFDTPEAENEDSFEEALLFRRVIVIKKSTRS